MAAPTVAVEISLDGSSWTDITSYTLRNRSIRFNRGKSSTLGTWEPGRLSLSFHDTTRALDPTNDAGTWQLSTGDRLRVKLNGTVHWYGWIDTVELDYVKGTSPLQLVLTVSASDVLGRLGQIASQGAGDSTEGLVSAQMSNTLSVNSWGFGSSIATATRYASNASYQTGSNVNLLSYFNELVMTEGGNARLYSAKSSSNLVFKARDLKGYGNIGFGDLNSSYAALSDWQIGADLDEWANQVTFTAAEHTDVYSSSTSITIGTGSKAFTVGRSTIGVSPGATVSIYSQGTPAATMTGTVTSLSGTTLTCNITATTSSGTYSDWSITSVESGAAQTVSDTQSFNYYGVVRARSFSTQHNRRTDALADAYILCADWAWSRPRVQWVEVDLAALGATPLSNVLLADLDYSVHVSQSLGQGTPSTISEYRMIDGIEHLIVGNGSHRVRFYLSWRVPTMDFTAVLQQNASTISSTTNHATYIVRDGWCTGLLNISANATGTAGTDITIVPTSLPTPALNDSTAGYFEYSDSGANFYTGTARYQTGGTIYFTVTGNASRFGTTPSLTVGSGDVLVVTFSFPVA